MTQAETELAHDIIDAVEEFTGAEFNGQNYYALEDKIIKVH